MKCKKCKIDMDIEIRVGRNGRSCISGHCPRCGSYKNRLVDKTKGKKPNHKQIAIYNIMKKFNINIKDILTDFEEDDINLTHIAMNLEDKNDWDYFNAKEEPNLLKKYREEKDYIVASKRELMNIGVDK